VQRVSQGPGEKEDENRCLQEMRGLSFEKGREIGAVMSLYFTKGTKIRQHMAAVFSESFF
jgi:hypothetical protein